MSTSRSSYSNQPTEAALETPLGEMVFRTIVGGVQEPLGDASATVRLLLFPLAPDLPEGMGIDGCVVAVWQATATEDGVSLAFRGEWKPESRVGDGGPNSGEHLMALTWEAPDAQATLGTSDEEMLSYAAEQGLLPARLAPFLKGEEASFVTVVGEQEGLEVLLPPLLAGETVQVHMVLAWVTGKLNEKECSPWFAVDVPPWDVANAASSLAAP